MADSKEDIDLLFRSFLIDKVNETYNKYYRNIEKDNRCSKSSIFKQIKFLFRNIN